LLGEGMITSEGSVHRAQRQAAQPAFHRQRIPAYAATMVRLAAQAQERWQPGAPFDVSLEMMHLTLAIVAKTLFDTELEDDVRELAAAINSIMGLYNFMIIIPAAEHLVHLPLPGILRFRRARRRLDAIVYRMIAEHRAGQRSGDDLLAMMLGSRASVSQEQLRDEVITIFLAGYETVANALAWTWYLLSQNPEVETRLHAELDSVLAGRLPNAGDYARLPYTEMVLAESMRLYPPAWEWGGRR
jgi:cytochrome P450